MNKIEDFLGNHEDGGGESKSSFGNITLDDLKKDNYRSSLRNVLIAESFYLVKEIEKYGSGMIRIRKELKEYTEIDLEMYEMGNFFNVVFRKRKVTTRKTVEKTTQNTTQKIIEIIREDPFISRRQLASRIGSISEDGIKYHIEKMKKKGILKRIGPAKGGHWEVVEDE